MKAVAAAIDAQRPDAVISVGEAATNNKVEIEYVAINVADATIADNEGHKPVDERLEADGPDGYFSTLPVKRIVSWHFLQRSALCLTGLLLRHL